MRIVHGLDALDPPLTSSVLTIGNFDGVHRAHRDLLAQAAAIAADTGGPLVVLTFEPHPLTIVSPGKTPLRLTTLDEKLHRLAEAGVDLTVVARSEPKLLALEAERFIEDVIVCRFHPRHIVEGPSFGFGRARKGTPGLLRRVAGKFGFEAHIIEPFTCKFDEAETVTVSSSLIRKLLAEGDVHRAALCLGRAHVLVGEVVKGSRRGAAIRVPTANLAVGDQLVPADGVYAGRAVVGDAVYPAAISVGCTPTFGGTRRRIEAHLLDFDGDLYSRRIRVEFARRLRRQRAFGSPDALAEQLRRDIEAVRKCRLEIDDCASSGAAFNSRQSLIDKARRGRARVS